MHTDEVWMRGWLMPTVFLCIIVPTTICSPCFSKCNCSNEVVNCAHQGLRYIDGQFSSNTKYIRLQKNQLNASVFSKLNKINRLDLLDLSNNNLSHVPIEAFANIAQLKTLKLRKNRLTCVPEAVASFEALKLLDLRHNQIEKITERELQLLADVEQVDLGRNNISRWPALAKTALNRKCLKMLNLSKNRLSVLKARQFASLHGLHTLKLAKNRVTRLESGIFDGLEQLKQLNLNRNMLQTLPPLIFNSLNELTILKLVHNHLTSIQPGAFHGANNLRHLNLSSNRLSSKLISDGGFYGLSALEELDLSKNLITTFPIQLHNYAPNLKKLWLKENRIKQLNGNKICLPDLKYLSLASNHLKSIQAGTFDGLVSLTELDLSNNSFAAFFENRSILRNFTLPSMKQLNFAANNLRVLRSNAFARFPALESLDLRDNPITTILRDSFDGIKLKKLLISTHSLHCDCHAKWFVQWLMNSKVDFEQVQVKCWSPTRLRGQDLLNISLDHLTCSSKSPLPRLFMHPQPLLKFLVGSHARVRCSGHGAGPLVLKWKRLEDESTAELKSNNSKFQIFTNYTWHEEPNKYEYIYSELQVNNLEVSDAGDYQCSIENIYGAVYSDLIRLVVQQAPEFRLKPSDVIANEGTNVLLECAADGDPTPLISWDKDKRKEFPAAVERRLHLRETEDGVYLLNVSKKDEGLYTCHVINEAQHISHSAYVQVNDSVQAHLHIADDPKSSRHTVPHSNWLVILAGLGLGIGIGVFCIGCLAYCFYTKDRDDSESARPLNKDASSRVVICPLKLPADAKHLCLVEQLA